MSTIDFTRLAMPGVQQLQPYQPGKPISELERELGISNSIKLASNENPLGASPRALTAMASVVGELGLYPDASGYQLKQKLAARHNVKPQQITLGNGSNDVLVMLVEAFICPKCQPVMSQYCFAVYPLATQAAGAKPMIIDALPADHPTMPLGHDLEAMLTAVDEYTRLIFIANPNNPVGSQVSADALRSFLQQVPEDQIVVVDEAYTEYATSEDYPDASQWLEEFPNLVVTRTFSKAYGLAGLRVGYALSNPQIADMLNRIRQPFNVNSLALVAAEAALDDHDFIQRTREMNQTGLAYLSAELSALGFKPLPSAGNFVLVDMGEPAKRWDEALLRAGVITRRVDNYGLPNYLRITIGTAEQNQRLVDALRSIRDVN